MTLYNLRTDPAGFRVTKFDDDLEVESSYLMDFDPTEPGSPVICECPAGIRPTCRHRQMLPTLLERLDTAWFLDHETQEWVDPTGQAEIEIKEHNEAELDAKLPDGLYAIPGDLHPGDKAKADQQIADAIEAHKAEREAREFELDRPAPKPLRRV